MTDLLTPAPQAPVEELDYYDMARKRIDKISKSLDNIQGKIDALLEKSDLNEAEARILLIYCQSIQALATARDDINNLP
jgi:hypothetical protein